MRNKTNQAVSSGEENINTSNNTNIYNQLKSLPDDDFSPLEYVPIPSFICKYDEINSHHLISCNLPFRTLFNLHDDLNDTVEKLIPISFANSICKHFSNESDKSTVIRCTERVSLNNSVCDLDITLSPIFSDTGIISYVSGTINNVTEIERFESNASDKFKHLQTAFNNVPGIMAVLNKNGTHEFSNQGYIRFFNRTFDDLSKVDANQLFSTYKNNFNELFNASLQGEESFFDLKSPGSDVQWKNIRFSMSPYRLSDDSIDGVLIFGHKNTSLNEADETSTAFKQLDHLTKLLNRNSCIAYIDTLVEKYIEKEKEFSILAIDIADFKTLNQTYGFERCDELLEKIARRIESVIREQDIVFRFGGNEFVCVLDKSSFDSLKVSARRIRNAIEQPYSIHDKKLHLTAYYGSSTFPTDGKTSAELVSVIDKTLQYAKLNNPNTLIEFSGPLIEKLERRSTITNELHLAIENEEFYLTYQPIIDLNTLMPVGAEALIRWNNNILGNVPPNDFIPIAEESDLIDDIGEFVIHKACKDLANIQKRIGNDKFTMALNTSARQFKRHKLLAIVKDCIETSGIAPGCLELEVTERQLIHDFEGAVSELNEIVEMGVKLSIDDFGNGYSSFSTLRAIPFDTLKIDRLFIQDITSRSDAFTLVKTITSMTRILGLNSVAEGIETRAQLNLLRNFAGCKFAQGFYFSHPVSLEDLVQYVEKSAETDN